jgi:hypothetical protein
MNYEEILMDTNDFYTWSQEHVSDYETLGDALLAFNTELKEERIPASQEELDNFIKSRQLDSYDLEPNDINYNLEELQYIFERVQHSIGNGYKQMK